jgi:histidinol phosphatase-like enzyme
MKVVFLDIDGVLNNTSTEETFEDYYFVEDEKVELLKQLVTRTNAKLVLSSTWREGWYARERIENPSKSFKSAIRLFEALEKKLSEYDLELLSYTEDFGARGEEIGLWLKNWNGEPIESFVILDDMYPEDLRLHQEKLVQTVESFGLTQEDVEKAVAMLK